MRRAVAAALVGVACAGRAGGGPGTREDRAALFDYILQATSGAHRFLAFQAARHRGRRPRDRGGIRAVRDVAHRDEFLAADTDAKLYHALTKLTCARWDGHLDRVRLVEGGIQPFAAYTRTRRRRADQVQAGLHHQAAMFLFVSDFAKDIGRMAGQRRRGRRSSATSSSASMAIRPRSISSDSGSSWASRHIGRTGGTWPTACRCDAAHARRRSSTAIG